MLFAEEDAPHLKKWIMKRLENTSDADADVLADYILALLRHDGDDNTIRSVCETEIPDFLKSDSSLFVADVFEAIQYKSYLPGAPPPPPKQILPPFLPPNGPSAMYSAGMGDLNGTQNGSRKRSYLEQAGNDMIDAGNFQYGNGQRNFKQPRRGGNLVRGGRFDNFEGSNRGGRQYQSSPPISHPSPAFQNLPSMPNPLPGMPSLDPNDPLAAMMALQQVQQAMGFPIPGMPPNPFPSPTGQGAEYRSPSIARPFGQKLRCQDYDVKGFCARGNACQFEHGSESIYVPPADEYDPSNSSLIPGLQHSPTNGIATPSRQPFGTANRGYDSGRGRGSFQRGDRGGQRGNANSFRRGGRAEFSSDRPNFDRTNTTIVVENIPEEKFSEETVREFFSSFGNITEVTMRPYKRLAIVKYDDWNSAKDAYSSPQVIFDNRFVKVYWYTSQENLPQPPAVAGTNGGIASNVRSGSANPTSAPARSTSEASVDIEEFAIKQQEAQRIQEEKAKKRADMEVAMKEMKLKQEALLKSHAEEHKKLMDRLAAKTGKSTKTQESSGSKEESEVERLKAVLASRKAEAERLDALGGEPALSDDTYGWRGRGRGRGGYRGRGTFPPRGGYRGVDRGGYRGRGGGAPFVVGSGAYNLDNRPKKVFLTGQDFTDPAKNESLREHLLGYDFTEIETGFEKSYIAFTDRKTAERFITNCVDGEIPGAGKVEMGWVPNGPLPPVKSTAQSTKQEDTIMDEGDAMAQDESSIHGGQHATELQQEVDYDVADDNDWAE